MALKPARLASKAWLALMAPTTCNGDSSWTALRNAAPAEYRLMCSPMECRMFHGLAIWNSSAIAVPAGHRWADDWRHRGRIASTQANTRAERRHDGISPM